MHINLEEDKKSQQIEQRKHKRKKGKTPCETEQQKEKQPKQPSPGEQMNKVHGIIQWAIIWQLKGMKC